MFFAQVTTPPVTLTIPSITLPAIVLTLIVATLAGALAQLLVGYTRGGCFASILIGVIGALIGIWIAQWLNLPHLWIIANVDVGWTFIGAAIFVALLALVMGGSRFGGYRGYRR